ncbi:MAG: FAD-binding oxidoreductase [Flavobacteriaceae bacterium]|nr:FAD-binding oxidoreductase [Flavobacteriaceae bacterium]
MEKDYIIVGLGLAGLAFTEELEKHNKSFVILDDSSQNASKVAAGMFNPVILKRFTPVWNGKKQIDLAIPFYKNLEEKLNKKYIHYVDIYHILKSVSQQNDWFSASDKPILSDYMISKIYPNKNTQIIAPFGLGKLINTGKIETAALLKDYKLLLQGKGNYSDESFRHKDLKIQENFVEYNKITAKKIVFCEGFGIKKNPFFNYLPLNEAKGELLIIKAPDLKIDYMLKASVFIIPLEKDLYKVGATFNWKDKTIKPTKEGREELVKKLNSVIKIPYTIVGHLAGIRPTVIDRRPLVGIHPKYKNLAILNGLGTRGVMLAPTMSKLLYQNIEKNKVLKKEISIARFS